MKYVTFPDIKHFIQVYIQQTKLYDNKGTQKYQLITRKP